MITSTSNPRIKNIIQLKKKGKERDQQGLFLVEGKKMALEAPAPQIAELYVSETFLEKSGREQPVAELLSQVRHEIVSDTVFSYLSDTRSPQGILCLLRQYSYVPSDLCGQTVPALCMILEHIQDPGNLGTILRAGEGAGVTGILLSSDCVDIYNPKVIRSTMGSIYRMPFCYTLDLPKTLRAWQARGIRLYAADLQGTCAYDQADYLGGSAFLIGNESRGLTRETAALANERIRIPMLGQVESLNAAVASSLLMYEAARQRRNF